MDAEIKKQWVESLRGGKYPQTQAVLKNGNGFCCLGVLEEVLLPKTKGVWEACGHGYWMNIPGSELNDYESESEDCELSDTSVKLSGLNDNAGGFQTKSDDVRKFVAERMEQLNSPLSSYQVLNLPSATSLMSLNDMGIPFPVIADVIEKFF